MSTKTTFEVAPEDAGLRLDQVIPKHVPGLSRRKTRVSAKVQRRIAQAIKRARHLALLPYTADQSRVTRKRR